MLQKRAKFAAKLARAQGELSPIPKDKTHPQGYKFQSADSIFGICRPLLARCGLALLPSLDVLDKGEGVTAKGAAFVTASARVVFTLIDTETGYSEAASFRGDALDYNGMEVQKAMTIAAKMFLKSLFLISESGDDPDEDNHGAPTPTTKAASAKQAGQPAPATKSAVPNAAEGRPILKDILTLQKALGINDGTMADALKKDFKVDSLSLLSDEQAAALKARLEAARKQKQQQPAPAPAQAA